MGERGTKSAWRDLTQMAGKTLPSLINRRQTQGLLQIEEACLPILAMGTTRNLDRSIYVSINKKKKKYENNVKTMYD